MNDRVMAVTGHLSKLLKYFPLKGRKPPETLRSLAAAEGRECRNCGHSTLKLDGANEAQRSLSPNERLAYAPKMDKVTRGYS